MFLLMQSFPLSCIGHPCLPTTQNAIDQGQKRAILRGTTSAVFGLPFEKDLLTQLHSELAVIHSKIHEECIELSTFSLMDN
jgi:hypothetical protein